MNSFFVFCFFLVNTYTVFCLCLGFRGYKELTNVFCIGDLSMCGFLLFTGGPGTNPLWILRDNLSFGGVKSYI